MEAALKDGGAQLRAKPGTAVAAVPSAGTQALAQPMPDDKILALYEKGSYEVVPHDGMRKIIAQRLTLSKQTIPHFYLTVECRLDELLRARERMNATAPKEGPRAFKLSVNDFVIKALALALAQVPAANVTWTEAGTLRHKYSDVGVAVAIEGGLFTPIIRHAELKSLSEISNEMKDLAERARKRRLAPHEYQGGTTSISNLGMYGIKSFEAVINPPHATILAVGAGEKRPVVVGRQDRGGDLDVLHAVRRPPGGGRRGRGRAAQRLQDADRGARAHAGVSSADERSVLLTVASLWRPGNRGASSTESAPLCCKSRAEMLAQSLRVLEIGHKNRN